MTAPIHTLPVDFRPDPTVYAKDIFTDTWFLGHCMAAVMANPNSWGIVYEHDDGTALSKWDRRAAMVQQAFAVARNATHLLQDYTDEMFKPEPGDDA